VKWSLNKKSLASYVARQLSFFNHSNNRLLAAKLEKYLPETQNRVRNCFSEIKRKYYLSQGKSIFNHTHGDHYAIFLYYLSNTIYRTDRDTDIAIATFSLNKLIHGLDAHPSVQLPEVFMLVHPLGTVLGKAKYANYFIAYQGVTVGSTEDGSYPEFSEGTVLFSGTSVIGRSKIGSDVVFGANSFLLKTDVPKDCAVIGAYPNHRFVPTVSKVRERFFR
jgi:serine O-acetyltransferase